MPEPCIFCENTSGSREHLWPKWIHERKDFGALRLQRGTSAEKIVPDPQITVKTVCGACNNGWMSALESENIPIIGCMLQDISTPLDEAHQELVSAWSVKSAMMSDSTKGRNAPNRFYDKQECLNMRLEREIPSRTHVWIGRLETMHLGDFGTDFTVQSQDKKRIGMGSVSTVVAGHFVTQVLTLHTTPEYHGPVELLCKQGDWEDNLIQIWPIQRPKVHWPPKRSFTNGGPQGLAYLMDRWRIGNKTDVIAQ